MSKTVSKKRILVVEDDFLQAPEIARALSDGFAKKSVQTDIEIVQSEADARSALEKNLSARSRYDICVVDLMLPWATGDEIPDPELADPRIRTEGPLKAGMRIIEYLRHIQKNDRRPKTQIVLYTLAQTSASIVERCSDLNFIYLEKSIEGDGELVELVSRISQWGDYSSKSPYLGRLLVCLFVKHDKQVDRLADFDEMLNTTWIPQFGSRVGRLIYVWHAIRSATDMVRIGLITWVIHRITRAFGL